MTSGSHDRALTYRFKNFRLIPAAGELWQEGKRLNLAPLTFRGLVYLIEHRTRFVGSDELGSAVWGRTDVSDVQVRKLIANIRQLFKDSARTQDTVRTIAGLGYRWVMTLESASGSDASAPTATPGEASVSSEQALAELSARTPDPSPRRAVTRSGLRLPVLVALMVLVAASLGWVAWIHYDNESTKPPVGVTGRSSLIVLPVEVDGPADSAWVSLGGMDLVANQLRGSDLPVPPTDSVILAMHNSGSVDSRLDLSRLKSTLGASSVLTVSAHRSKGQWNVSERLSRDEAVEPQVECQNAEVVAALRNCTDLLLASIGKLPARQQDESDELSQALQQARAAVFTGELETARSILDRLSNDQQQPRVIQLRADIAFRAGQFSQSRSLLEDLIADPALSNKPAIKASALTILASIAYRLADCAQSEARATEALTAMESSGETPDREQALSVRGLARTCLEKFDAASDDLNQARADAEANGDRFAAARAESHLGTLEIQRDHPEKALAHFSVARDVFAGFGSYDQLGSTLSELIYVESELLQRTDALENALRLGAVVQHVKDPSLKVYFAVVQVNALAAAGHLNDAETALRQLGTLDPALPGYTRRAFWSAQADLSFAQGRYAEARDASDKALATYGSHPVATEDGLRSHILLIRRRAAIAADTPMSAATTNALTRDTAASLLAQAEWAAGHDAPDHADQLYRQASTLVEGGRPQKIAEVSISYGYWLLSQNRLAEAAGQAGRIALWSGRDFDCALYRTAVFGALQKQDAWTQALSKARELAGDRVIPVNIQSLAEIR